MPSTIDNAASVAPVALDADAIKAAATATITAKAAKAAPKRALKLKPAADAPLGTEANAQAERSNVAKPASKPAVKAAKAAPASKAAKPASDKAEPAYRGATRDAAGIVRSATNFDQYSTRDSAYLAFFGNVARAVGSDTISLKQIHDNGKARDTSAKRYNPNYTGSAKATDVGAINRLCADGYFTKSADGFTLTATAKAKQSKAYANT
jgi:hypothetical protein